MEKTWTSELPDHGKVIVIKGPQVGEIWCRFDIWFFLELYLEGVSQWLIQQNNCWVN